MKSDHILFFTPTKKYIEFPFAIRKGICENCGKSKAKREISVTVLHHKNNKYDLENPLWNTIEVCLECHEKLDPRLRALKKNQRYWLGSNAHKMRCPTCQAFAIFGSEGSAPDYLYHSKAGYRSYRDYSVEERTVKIFKCPTCQRRRAFTPKGSMNYKEWKDWKKVRKALRVLSKKSRR
uniref:Uncharacterized protein n=1 Tax=uncultured marine crenarchaeote HF4000_ANIW133K13 TaxID=455572 RepID=B3T425_9ARCH|nr:hypothetical protein ALOHA_HF4000ANIW133K13ctg1g9 [uncultured marine crenarchaeote HF4000_ANIW133K13]